MNSNTLSLEEITKSLGVGLIISEASENIIFVNQEAQKLLGWKSKEMLGKNIHDLLHYKTLEGKPLLRIDCPNIIALYKNKKSFRTEDYFIKKNGEPFAIRLDANPIVKNNKTQKAIITFLDISKQKKAEDQLRKERELLDVILKNIDYGITVQTPQGQLLFANDSAAKTSGFNSAREFLSTPVTKITEKFEMLDENGDPFPLDKLPGRLAIQGQFPPETEIRFKVKATNQERWSTVKATPVKNSDGKVEFAINVFQDITKKKQTEETILRLAAIVESSDDAIISQSLEGKILSWNPGAEKLYGFSAQEVINKSIRGIVPHDKIDEYHEIMEIIKMDQSIDHLETSRVTKDGRQLDMSLTISPLKDHSGKIIGASGIGRDISIAKELERRKDAFISMASHELKTPITSMKAFIQVLEKKLENHSDESIKRFLSKTDEQLNRLTNLVSDLLDLSKIQQGKLELSKDEFDLNTLIIDRMEEVQATTQNHGIILDGKVSEKIIGDKDRIGQVLINLLTNAVKYSPQGNAVLIKVIPNKNKVTISVQDHGIGISKTHQKRIFDRFYRAAGANEKTYPGLGIGLYISSEIIKRHGGKIWVNSVKRKGSTFSFSLPLK